MKKRILFYSFYILALLLLFSTASSGAEKIHPVQATAKVLKSKIKIGDEIRFLVQVDYPRKFLVTLPSEKMNLSPFEIKKIDVAPTRKGQNRVQESYGLTLTVFEIGDLKIPPLSIHYQDETGKTGQAWTDSVPVTVVSIGKKLTDKDDIRPLKGPASLSLLRFRTWILGLLAALLAVFLVVKLVIGWLQRNKGLESLKAPHLRVKIELERLKNEGLLEGKKVKEYYSALSDILRNYIDRVWELQAHEHTTVEILDLLKEKNLDKEVAKKIQMVLEVADLVKFAKVVPERALADRLESEILDVADMTKPVEKDKVGQ